MKELPPLPDDLRRIVCEFLSTQPVLALATAGDQDGRPQVAPLFFVSDDNLNLYWFSDQESRHGTNLADWEDASATVYRDTWDWAHIRGLQIEGDAVPVSDKDERDQAQALYQAKFDFVNDRFAELLAHSTIYVLRPRWLRWMDNEQHMGYSQEYSLEAPG